MNLFDPKMADILPGKWSQEKIFKNTGSVFSIYYPTNPQQTAQNSAQPVQIFISNPNKVVHGSVFKYACSNIRNAPVRFSQSRLLKYHR